MYSRGDGGIDSETCDGSYAPNVLKREGAYGEWPSRWWRGDKIGLGFLLLHFFHCINLLLFFVTSLIGCLNIVNWMFQIIFIVIFDLTSIISCKLVYIFLCVWKQLCSCAILLHCCLFCNWENRFLIKTNIFWLQITIDPQLEIFLVVWHYHTFLAVQITAESRWWELVSWSHY